MKSTKTVSLVLGFLIFLVGVIWIGQGTGYFPYPASSFMIDQTPWAYRGVILAIVGLILMVISRRFGRRPKP